MPKAIWNGTVIADAKDEEVEIVEGNVYFSSASVNQHNLRPSDKVTTCPWRVRPTITTWWSCRK
jgi:uncharacterized protein (DUF427 family)